MSLYTMSSPGHIMRGLNNAELLVSLTELKNSIIGNTWKKVEVADKEGLLSFLLDKANVKGDTQAELEIAGEVAVIIGSVASEGSLTVRQLLKAGAPEQLLSLIRGLAQTTSADSTTLLTSALRALRNVLVSTADMAWGNMWGVGRERRVVGTGLVGPRGNNHDMKDSNVDVSSSTYHGIGSREGKEALGLIFQPTNLDALLSLLGPTTPPQIAIPLYQIFARLISQPSHRQILALWTPVTNDHITPSNRFTQRPSTYILHHIAEVIKQKPNPKLLEAALDLLAALVKDEGALAGDFCFFCKDDSDLAALRNPRSTISEMSRASSAMQGTNTKQLIPLLEYGQTPVRIAAAACLVNIYNAKPKSAKFELTTNIPKAVIPNLGILLDTENAEERTKLCFVLATLVNDDPALQSLGAAMRYPERILDVLEQIETHRAEGHADQDSAARGREAAFLALAALASSLESTRVIIADGEHTVMEYLREALTDPSYGVRAAACQLVRALSRTVALVRTSLMDSGVASAIVLLFANYSPSRTEEIAANCRADAWNDGGESWPDRDYVIEITAMAALCNLVTDCMPLKEMLLGSEALRCICTFTQYPSETIVVNALWTLKNLMFKSVERDKSRIIDALGTPMLMKHTSPSAPTAVNIQALGVIQNYLADGSLADLNHALDRLGEAGVFGAIQSALHPDGLNELRVAAFRVLVNLSWGNERLRQTIVRHEFIVTTLVDALDSPYDEIKFCALKAIRNLITSTTKSERPRVAILAPFRPYNIGSKVKTLAQTSPNLDVSTVAVALDQVLDRVRPGSDAVMEDPLDR